MEKQLEITEFQLEELRIERNPEYEDGAGAGAPVGVSVDFDLFTNEDEANRFAVGLVIRTCDPNTPGAPCPLKVVLRLVGFFVVPEPLPEGKVPFPIAVNGLTILYGIARGVWATSAGWFGNSVILPTVYFSDRLKAKQIDGGVNEIKVIEAAGVAAD